jgi:hypothetical protein
MIDHLDKSLEALLRRKEEDGGLPKNLKDTTITFAPPGEGFPPADVVLPAIDLFLYDVREDRDLRSNEWFLEKKPDGTATRKRSPIRISCSYLVTAWLGVGVKNPAQTEHQLLGEVMKVLLRFPTLPPEILQGDLKAQVPSPPTAALHPGRLESWGEFWQTLGGRAKAALNYSVTFGIEVFPGVPAEPPVLEKELKIRIAEREYSS